MPYVSNAEWCALLKRVADLEARLAKYENPHTPPSKNDFGKRDLIPKEKHKKPGQKKGHEGITRETREPDEKCEVLQKECDGCGHVLGKPFSNASNDLTNSTKYFSLPAK